MHAVMLAGTSALMLVWRPCRSREGRMPRSAVAMLLLSAAGLWAGSLAMVIHLLVGSDVGLLEACGRAWGLLADGPPSAARTGVAAAWLLAFPVRAGVRVGGRLVGSGRLRRHLCASGRTLDGYPDTVLVDGLGTPAATIGILRRVVAVDGAWWTSASSVHRRVVLAHEHAHRRGLHGLIEAAAARSCGRDHAGRALAELSLAAARPAVGLAVTGDGAVASPTAAGISVVGDPARPHARLGVVGGDGTLCGVRRGAGGGGPDRRLGGHALLAMSCAPRRRREGRRAGAAGR